jgi:MFS family permease
MLGSRLTTIAYPMLVLYLAKSPVMAGFAVFVVTAPSILVYIPAGALVDRWDPRRTMLVSETGRGVAIGIVVGALLFHRPSVSLIIVAAVMEEVLEIFATLAERRYITALVGADFAGEASIRTETRTHVVVLAGRPLGALLFECRSFLPFLADLVSFIISICVLIGIGRKAPPPRARVPNSPLQREMLDGWRWFRADESSRFAMPLKSSMTLISQALIMIFIVEARSWHLSSVAIGVVLAASGFGGALGALIGSRVPVLRKHSRIKIQVFTWFAGFFVLAVAGVSYQVVCMIIVMAALGFMGSMGNIEFDAYLMRQVSDDKLARVTSIDRLMSFAACAVGPALGGILIGTCGAQTAVRWLCGMAAILAVFAVVVARSLDRVRPVVEGKGAKAAGEPGPQADAPAVGGVSDDAQGSRAPALMRA